MHKTDTPAINDPRFLPDVDPVFEYYLVDKPKLTFESPEHGPFIRAFVRLLEGFLGRHEMEGHYQALKAQDIDSKMFFREAFKLTNITLDGDTSPLADIPKDRPVLFIANHPFGVIDGLIMCNIALDFANDFQVIINSLVLCAAQIPPTSCITTRPSTNHRATVRKTNTHPARKHITTSAPKRTPE